MRTGLYQQQLQKAIQLQRLTASQMIQVKLLEMPLAQLEETVNAELDDNPALETLSDNEYAENNDNAENADALETYEQQTDNVVETAINQLTREHDLDFERLWVSFNQTDKRILLELVEGKNPMQMRQRASSTQYSALKRMMQMGYVIRNEQYEVEDPFFKYWIRKNVL